MVTKMKHYTIKEFNDRALLKEEKLQEIAMTVNTVQDAQEVIGKCITFILKKKRMNPAICMSIIGDGILSGIDSIDDYLPNIAKSNPEAFEAKKKVISARIARKLLAYSKTK
jgi:hypothetical protein